MAAKRVGLTKKVRFEVFKRDSFRCQYCGASAPDVLLVVDHIHPVASGGKNIILNLITACQPCNAGKGKRELSDHSVVEKQRDQLQDLSERREQLEMMISWKEGMCDLRTLTVDRLADLWAKLIPGVLDRLALSCGLPRVIRTDNGKEFCGKAMVEWAHARDVDLRLIEPGKPNQNAYIESFSGRLRDECLNEHWFTNHLQARTINLAA